MAGVLVVAIAVAALTRGRFAGSFNALEVDLGQPDLLVRSARLSALSKDLVAAPLLRDILTEDFVHYYEDHPTRLSLLGTVKRLAYDHQLTWSDRLVATVLDAPGEIALWRDGKGRPEHFVLMLEHNLATQAVLQLAKVALPDSQLSVAGEVGPLIGRKSTVYAVRINARTTWLFASRGERTVVLSHPGLLLKEDGSVSGPAADIVAKALGTDAGEVSPFARDFGLEESRGLQQQIAAKTAFLSFGYQHFFPDVKALRLDLSSQGGWSLSAQASGAALDLWRGGATRLWSALPRASALCAALPLDLSRAEPLLQTLDGDAGVALAKDLQPVAGVCWGRAGGLFAPTLALQLRDGVEGRHDETLARLLQRVTADARRPAADDADDADDSTGAATAAPSAEQGVQASNLSRPAGGKVWKRTVVHEFGAVKHNGQRADVVSIARLGPTLIASTDARAVEQAVAVAAKTYPALSDKPVDGAVPVLYVDGGQLSGMLDAETWRVLKPSTVPTFSRVARELLPPRLKAVARLGTVQVGLPASAKGGSQAGWVPLLVHQEAGSKQAAGTP